MPTSPPRDACATDGPGPPSHPSPRVRLEVELLTSGFATPLSADAHPADEAERRPVLIAARDPDLRRYLHECLAGERGLRLFEAASVIVALDVARSHVLHLLVVDFDHQAILARLPEVPAIVVADVSLPEPPRGSTGLAPRATLPPPFAGQELRQLAYQLLG